MARYLWFTWSLIVFHLSVNFLLQERTNVASTAPVNLEVFPFKIWLAQRADIYLFGALVLPFCSAIALALLALHLHEAHGASHFGRLPAVIDSEKLKSPVRPTRTDRKLDRSLRVAWPLLFVAVSVWASWHFVMGFMHQPVFVHDTGCKFFDCGWINHLGHLNPFISDLRYATAAGVTYIAGLFPYFAVANLAACSILALFFALWLPSPLWKRSPKT